MAALVTRYIDAQRQLFRRQGALTPGSGDRPECRNPSTLGAGFNYALTSNDGNVAAGQSLTVDGSALGSGNSMTFNGAAETDGAFVIKGGAGADTLTGGAGNDTFSMGGNLTAADKLNGGGGGDLLTLNGDYSGGLTLGATTLTGVGTIGLAAGHSYNITSNDATAAAGTTLSVDGSALGAGDAMTFNGFAAETNGTFAILRGRAPTR